MKTHLQTTAQRVLLIGGSAGSLSALQDMFQALPSNCGLAYIVVQHLSPQHQSHLDSLISQWTANPVHQALDGTRLEPDHIYVVLPGNLLMVEEGVLRVHAPGPDSDRHAPIDFLCQSVASEFCAHAALVVLSGTGHDGTAGAKAIKDAHGVVIVQDEASAEFAGMPSSVLGKQLADRVEIPARIAQLACVWGRTGQLDKDSVPPLGSDVTTSSDDELIKQILDLVREHAHQDMLGYKPSTLRRRIERRIGLRHAHDLEDYLQLLGKTPTELDQLARDLLIGVTTFFRDPEAFKIMEEVVIPRLCEAKQASESVRVWIAGCSTGEEAYSIAMLLMEWFSAHDQAPAYRSSPATSTMQRWRWLGWASIGAMPW